MKAGRELDALVAEKVMGHKITMWNELFKVAKRKNDIPVIMLGETQYKPIPSYSTNIADVWQVVEELSAYYGVEVYQDKGVPCECNVYHLGSRKGMAIADTVPLAICLAALEAVEGSEIYEPKNE